MGLFVTLGSYSREALDLERVRRDMRLCTGADVVGLTLSRCDDLPQPWRARLPLRHVYEADREPEGR